MDENKHIVTCGAQSYFAKLDKRGVRQWVEFKAPSQKANSLFVPLELVIKIARSLPSGVLFGNDYI